MVHIHRNNTTPGGAPVVNLFPLGSLVFPNTWTGFNVVAGESYKIAGSFNASALELGELQDAQGDSSPYTLEEFIDVSCLPDWLHMQAVMGSDPLHSIPPPIHGDYAEHLTSHSNRIRRQLATADPTRHGAKQAVQSPRW